MLGSDDDDDDDGVDANVQWDDEEGDEEEEEEEEEPCLCLTCESKLPSVHAALEHMHRSHAVDLVKLCHDLKLDDYGTMRLVNYLRADASRVTTMAQERDLRKRLLEDDSLLKPVLESDPLLYGMHRDGARVLTPLQELEEIVAEAATTMPSATNATLVANPVEDLLKAVATVDNVAVQQLLALYKDTSAQLAETQARLSAVERSFRNYSEMSEAALHPDVAAVVADASSFDAAAVLPTQQQPQLDYYFSSYSHYGIHEEMLKVSRSVQCKENKPYSSTRDSGRGQDKRVRQLYPRTCRSFQGQGRPRRRVRYRHPEYVCCQSRCAQGLWRGCVQHHCPSAGQCRREWPGRHRHSPQVK